MRRADGEAHTKNEHVPCKQGFDFGHIGGLKCFARCGDNALLSELKGKLKVKLVWASSSALLTTVTALPTSDLMMLYARRSRPW